MAGLPLKSGADFYNLEAARLRLHNLGADPTEVGAGLIYFNTSTGMNTSKKARIYTGDAWKTIAFSEDLDVASNADFLALKERVDLLSGDIDTDAIISNMREVSEFLEGFAEDASLMDLLNGKLNTSGGTINSGNAQVPLMLSSTGATTRIAFLKGETLLGYLAFSGVDTPQYITAAGREYDLLHEGNYSDFALPLTGGTLKSSGTDIILKLNSNQTYNAAWVEYNSNDVKLGYLGFNGVDTPAFYSTSGIAKTLLHSGNVGDYAFRSKTANDGDVFDTEYNIAGYGAANNGFKGGPIIRFGLPNGYYHHDIQALTAQNKLYSRYVANGVKSDWREIAFTDSDITGNAATATVAESARTLLSAENFKLFYTYPNINTWSLGYYSHHGNLDFETLSFRYGSGYNTAMLINSSGNVTIGDQDYAGTGYRLWVNGPTNVEGNLRMAGELIFAGGYSIQSYNGTALSINPQGNNILLSPNGYSNVLIGTTEDNGAKLQVNGAISVLGDGATNGGLAVNWGTESQYHLGSNASNDFYISSSNNAAFRIVVGGADRMLINSSGNILIGATTDRGHKLAIAKENAIGSMTSSTLHNSALFVGSSNSNDSFGMNFWTEGNGNGYIQQGRTDEEQPALYNLILQPFGRNVLIGTTEDNGAKLQVAGKVYSSITTATDNYGQISNATNTLRMGVLNSGRTFIHSVGNYHLSLGTNDTERIRITDGGNVLIGTTDEDGSGARLQVSGDISIPNNHYIAFSNTAKTPLYQLWMTGNNVFFVGRGSVENGHESVYCGKTIRFATGDSAWNNSASIDENGNLHVDGNLHVKGNIIADGEISGGGRAEEGGTIGGDGAEKVTATIEVGLKFKEISHTLGDNVIVQVYEWNANGQTWDMVLTDVETTTNLVTVRFGNETDVPHKVVII